MLAAGTSTRMGKENKMLIPVNGVPIVSYCCLQALEYLQSLEEKSTLTVVTGYRRVSLHKALKPCRDFIEKTDKRIEMIEVFNPDFRSGQFSSAKTGVKNVSDNSPFFISLADMPLITSHNYAELSSKLGNYDAVRPSSNKKPGHPVLFSPSMKNRILKASDLLSVREILENCNTLEIDVEDSSCTQDIDNPEDIHILEKIR